MPRAGDGHAQTGNHFLPAHGKTADQQLALARIFQIRVAVQAFFVEAQQTAAFGVADAAFAHGLFDIAAELFKQRRAH